MPTRCSRTCCHGVLLAATAPSAFVAASLNRSDPRERGVRTPHALGGNFARVVLTLASLVSAATAAPRTGSAPLPRSARLVAAAPVATVAPFATDRASSLDADAVLARLFSLAGTSRSRAIAVDPLLVHRSVCVPDSTERPHANASCESSLLLRGTRGATVRATLTVHWHDERFVGFVLHLPPPTIVDLTSALARRLGLPAETIVAEVQDASGTRPVTRATWRAQAAITMLELERDALAGDTLSAIGAPQRTPTQADVFDSRSL